jgi:hypothetical protein
VTAHSAEPRFNCERWWTLGLPIGVLLIGILAELLAILRLNSGHFTYTLDDPYIHIALAQRIREGFYGINPGEPCAPASSIAWPFLLAPAATLPGFRLLPFALNLVAAVGTVVVYRKVLAVVLGTAMSFSRSVLIAVGSLLLILLTNLVGLVFTGMEHSLQVLLVALVALGLIREAESGDVPRWLPWIVVAGPTVRYESLAVSAAALAYLLARRHYRIAVITAVGTLVPVGVFAGFLLHLGLGPLPASVVLLAPVLSSHGLMWGVVNNLRTTLRDPTGVLLTAAAAWMLGLALFSHRSTCDRAFAGSVVLAIGLHILTGRYGAYHRWEMYVVAFVSLIVLYLARHAISSAKSEHPAALLALVSTLWCVSLGSRYLFGLLTIPVASNNIYEQQYQMHRFAVTEERGPVAVNDIGYVSFGNRAYVLDLLGLASPGIAAMPEGPERTTWMEQAAERHGVEVAMLYDEWYPLLPRTWRKVGTLHLSRPRITPAWADVSFYATSPTFLPDVSARIRDFAATLPAAVRFEFVRARTQGSGS